MGAWGAGLYQDDTALDVRDLWRAYRRIGLHPAEASRRLLAEIGDDDSTVVWLALADCQWRTGQLQAAVRRQAMQIIRRGEDLERWEDDQVGKRRRTLDRLAQQLRSPMPKPRAVHPSHPCDWRAGEHLLWRTVDRRWAVLRVVRVDPRWGGGGSPVCELVGVLPGAAPVLTDDLVDAPARTALRAVRHASGGQWRGRCFAIGVFAPGEFFPRRLRRVPSARRRTPARSGGDVLGISWSELDQLLFAGFALPIRPGTVLRRRSGATATLLSIVDIQCAEGEPLIVVEFPVWDAGGASPPGGWQSVDVRRSGDTVAGIRARVVDPAARAPVAKLMRQLGVRSAGERVPVRVGLLGHLPADVEAVGTRVAVTPAAPGALLPWSELDAFLARLRADEVSNLEQRMSRRDERPG